MERLKQLLKEQPALITAIVESGFAVLMAFGLDWSAEQVGTVMAFVNLVGGVVVYLAVMPMSKVRDIQSQRNVAFEQFQEAQRLIREQEDLATWLLAEQEHRLTEPSMRTKPGPMHVDRPNEPGL